MATENVFIDKPELARAAIMAETRITPDGKPFIFTDKGVRGLRLFVQSSKASWIVRWNNTSKVLGYHYPKDDIKSITDAQARELAQAALRMLQAGKKTEVDGLIKAFHEQRRGKKSVTKAVDDLVPEVKTWTLRECFEHTIQDKRLPGAKNPIGNEMEKDMRITMNRTCFQKIIDKPAALVSIGDIEKVRDDVYRELQALGKKGVSPSNKVITHTRAVYEHCASHNRATSGINPEKPWWKMLATRFANPKRTRRPQLEDAVRTLILAEEYLTKPLPGRAIRTAGTNPGTLAGLWWLLLTVQRATAGLTLLPYNIGVDLERPDSGWLLAAWDETEQKGGASFVLPVPKRAWEFVNGFRERNRNASSARWLFPSERNPEKHATPSGVYRIVYRLAGRDEVEQKKAQVLSDTSKKERKKPSRTPRRNLLEEHQIDFWSPHDLRRTVTAFLKANKIPGAASAILAHEVNETESLGASSTAQSRMNFSEQQMKRITQMAYADGDSGAQFIELKSKAMKLWTDAVIDCYEELSPRIQAQRAMERRARIERYIYRDVDSIDVAIGMARKLLPAAIDAARKKAEWSAQSYAESVGRSDVKLEYLQEEKRRMQEDEAALEKLLSSPEEYLAEQSLTLRTQTLAGIMHPDYAAFDFSAEAPDYVGLRARYIAGEWSLHKFQNLLTAKYGFDFSRSSDSIYLPGKDPRQNLQQAA